MPQIQMQSAAVSTAVKPTLSCRFVIRFVVSSISSLAVLGQFCFDRANHIPHCRR